LCWFQIWNFSCVHGFDLGPIFVLGGFSFDFFTRTLRPGPFWCSSARACAVLRRRRPDSASLSRARVSFLPSSPETRAADFPSSSSRKRAAAVDFRALVFLPQPRSRERFFLSRARVRHRPGKFLNPKQARRLALVLSLLVLVFAPPRAKSPRRCSIRFLFARTASRRVPAFPAVRRRPRFPSAPKPA
jgi:hypothetical protein